MTRGPSLISTVHMEPENDPVGQAIAEQVSPTSSKPVRGRPKQNRGQFEFQVSDTLASGEPRKSSRLKKKPHSVSLAQMQKVNSLALFDPQILLNQQRRGNEGTVVSIVVFT